MFMLFMGAVMVEELVLVSKVKCLGALISWSTLGFRILSPLSSIMKSEFVNPPSLIPIKRWATGGGRLSMVTLGELLSTGGVT